jgi:hypothetical protein
MLSSALGVGARGGSRALKSAAAVAGLVRHSTLNSRVSSEPGCVVRGLSTAVRERDFDVVVIGGGHAGTEAAAAAARRGARTALVTPSPVSSIGEMSCNPSIGGLAKGTLVREVDALDGLMGVAADAAGIQFRILNASKGTPCIELENVIPITTAARVSSFTCISLSSRSLSLTHTHSLSYLYLSLSRSLYMCVAGPAVRGPRAQMDRTLYKRAIQDLVGAVPNLTVIDGAVTDLIVGEHQQHSSSSSASSSASSSDAGDAAREEGSASSGASSSSSSSGVGSLGPPGGHPTTEIRGVELDSGVKLRAPVVVITTGTFLKGVLHIGGGYD